MECWKDKKGVSLITLVITIVVIIILAAIGYNLSDNNMNEAISVKFKQELTDVKRGVETVKLINSKQGLDEDTLNKNFKKVYVENPPQNFISFDEDKLTAYLIDLKEIDYKELKTGQEYKNMAEGDTVTFDEDDVYVYDKAGTVYYVKGMYIEGTGILYTVDETRVDGPLISAENTTGGIVQVRVTPTNGGEITSVTVGGKIATKVDEGIYEVEMDKNGSYIVTATEEGSGTSKTVVNVTKLTEDDSGDVVGAPTHGTIRINNNEPYTKSENATLTIETDSNLIYIKHVTSGTVPIIPTESDSGWRNKTDTYPLILAEGQNDVYVWFRNRGNSTILEAHAEIILDTTAPTATRPDVEIYDEHSFRITCKQEDPPIGSGLRKIEVGYKLQEASEYTWVAIPNLTTKTIEIENNRPDKEYQIKTRAEDNVGHVTESQEYLTALNGIPAGVKIEYNPTAGWTKRSTVTITYPAEANDIYEKWYRLDKGDWQVASNYVEILYIEENMTIEAVVVKRTESETLFGEIVSVTINNIDNEAPIISEIDLDPINVVNNEDYRGSALLTDNKSGIVAYTVNQSSVTPTTWTYLKESTQSMSITYDVMVGIEYYIWVMDAAENISNEKVIATKIDVTSSRIIATLDETEIIYTGLEIKPVVTVEDTERGFLREGIQYDLVYENNINVGTGKVTITAKRAYEGVIELEYQIMPATPTITLRDASYLYDRGTKTIGTAVVAGTPNGTQPSGAITYKYYVNSALTTLTSSTNGATTAGGPPSKEGIYYVVAEIAAAGNYTAATSNTATLTIEKSPVTVTFDANGGNVGETSRIVYYDHTYGENGALPTPTRTYYIFLYWTTADGTRVTSASTVNTNTAHTLYANWQQREVTVTFNGNSGSFYVSRERQYVNGSTITTLVVDSTYNPDLEVYEPTTTGTTTTVKVKYLAGNSFANLPRPTRSEYDFDGWYTRSSNGSYISTSSIVPDSDSYTLYAHWDPDECDCGGCNSTYLYECSCYGSNCSTCGECDYHCDGHSTNTGGTGGGTTGGTGGSSCTSYSWVKSNTASSHLPSHNSCSFIDGKVTQNSSACSSTSQSTILSLQCSGCSFSVTMGNASKCDSCMRTVKPDAFESAYSSWKSHAGQ